MASRLAPLVLGGDSPRRVHTHATKDPTEHGGAHGGAPLSTRSLIRSQALALLIPALLRLPSATAPAKTTHLKLSLSRPGTSCSFPNYRGHCVTRRAMSVG